VARGGGIFAVLVGGCAQPHGSEERHGGGLDLVGDRNAPLCELRAAPRTFHVVALEVIERRLLGHAVFAGRH
jgi:hypothetical protein